MDSQSDAVNRRLAAILAADATNYSGLVAQDEETALRTLAGHRAAIDASIAAHGGRIFSTAGDSVLAEFSSPVQAVRAAIEIQRVLQESNAAANLPAPMLFRVGVNVGDVVVDGDNILGDGVNVAVRLENLAPPGGICVSANVRDHVQGKVECHFQDLGTQFLKNIPRPVRAFQVLTGSAGLDSFSSLLRCNARLVAAGAATAVLAVAGLWFALAPSTPDRVASPPATSQAVTPSPNQEEIAYWESVKLATDPAELRNYLTKFPKGTFAELARTRLEGILAGQSRSSGEKEAAAKRANAERAQQEAARLKDDAEAAIARAAAEQKTAARLRAEAEQAAARAAAAAKAAADAAQQLARAQSALASASAERTLVRTASPLDGRWLAEVNCDASAERPTSSIQLPAQIRYREIRIEQGRVGLPGYFRAYGSVAEDGTFQLLGVSLPRTQRIVGAEDAIKVNGRTTDSDRMQGSGAIGNRLCSLTFNRLAAQ